MTIIDHDLSVKKLNFNDHKNDDDEGVEWVDKRESNWFWLNFALLVSLGGGADYTWLHLIAFQHNIS